MKQWIQQLVDGRDLGEGEMVEAMEAIMGGEATPAQMAAFLTALRLKGETVAEITGAARVMRERATPVKAGRGAVSVDRDEINGERESMVDTCGTGGDGTRTFNISTTTAFVLAGAGVVVAKHGNRSVSSQCGSADVLEALGVTLDVPVGRVERCLGEIGIGFLYAPLLHSAMRHVAPVRRELGIRTVFNLLGPLTNPAGARRQVLGVYRRELTGVLARVLGRLGSERAFVVHGADGLDEVTVTGPTHVAELREGAVSEYALAPEDFGLPTAPVGALQGGDARENAAIVRAILGGEEGPRRHVVLANAAVALVAAGVAADWRDGVGRAEDAIDSGRASEKLARLIEETSR